jgi:peptidoglycan/LPS O-acetylase OafA/YrhL
MSKIIINKEQTDFIKGVGILLIVLHNYFHWVPPNPGENEFIFNAQNAKNVFSIISDSYLNIVNVLFSFFGHYGVQLFVFISGYGLSKSFISKQQNFSTFIKKRASKIYPAFLIGILVLIIYNAIVYSQLPSKNLVVELLYKISMIHTLLPDRALSINGPWWFYGLIMQLYFIFIPVFYVIKRWEWKGFLLTLVLSYLLIYCLYTPLIQNNIFIMANAPGHIPEFALGIFLALKPKLTIKIWYLPLLLLIFILGNFSFSFFPFTFITITYLSIIILYLFREEHKYFTVIKFYGKISMYLFAVHGFFRTPYFVGWAKASNSPIKAIALGMLYLLTVTIVAYLSREIYALIKKWLMYIKK